MSDELHTTVEALNRVRRDAKRRSTLRQSSKAEVMVECERLWAEVDVLAELLEAALNDLRLMAPEQAAALQRAAEEGPPA